MTIYRGPGGGGNATNDSALNAVAALSIAAETAATQAGILAGNAEDSASEAATSASEASTSASGAATSASTASTQAAIASSSASAAATSASNAATSASNAVTTLSTAVIKANNLSDLTSASTARTNLGLGSAATTASTAYATAAQGGVADTALQASSPLNNTLGATTPATASVTVLTASADSAFTSTGAVQLSSGTTGQRPTGAAGKLRFNSTTAQFEGYNGDTWASVGGAAISNDTTTATDVFPLFADATSGTALTVFTGNSKLLYKPSTGELKSSVLNAGNGIVINNQTVTASYSIAAGGNGMSVGPITVASGQTVTVASGSRWVVL